MPTSKNIKKSNQGIVETFKTIFYAICIALVFRSLAFEPFSIPSGSMKPTLLVGDYLFVSKFSYGYSRHSFPMSIIPFNGRIFWTEPKRGDVAVFKFPRDNETDYIKRIVGLPGDEVKIVDGKLYVNNNLVKREYDGDFRDKDKTGSMQTYQMWKETNSANISYFTLDATPMGPLDNTAVYKVPEGFYFAMGDNRDQSSDSRILSHVGYIPRDNLVGKASILFFSIDDARFWEFWKWPTSIRFKRIGKLL